MHILYTAVKLYEILKNEAHFMILISTVDSKIGK